MSFHAEVADLASTIALHFSPEHRVHYDENLLRKYREVLQQETSTEYGWDSLLSDWALGFDKACSHRLNEWNQPIYRFHGC